VIYNCALVGCNKNLRLLLVRLLWKMKWAEICTEEWMGATKLNQGFIHMKGNCLLNHFIYICCWFHTWNLVVKHKLKYMFQNVLQHIYTQSSGLGKFCSRQDWKMIHNMYASLSNGSIILYQQYKTTQIIWW
jgi:hypothetical protein